MERSRSVSRFPRLRLFAGPNGSGKSTLKEMKELPAGLLGHYLNADDLKRALDTDPLLSFASYGLVAPSEEAFREFFALHSQTRDKGQADTSRAIRVHDGYADFSALPIDSYVAAVVIDWLRQQYISGGQTFSLETVMSHPEKVAGLQQAQAASYRPYLYYVSTESPDINVARVRYRVEMQGGHDVPEDKIRQRYYRSLDLLYDALRHCHRAYFFDNSGPERLFIAEMTPDKRIISQLTDDVDTPDWFARAVLHKLA